MARRKTIPDGNDPLSAILGAGGRSGASVAPERRRPREAPQEQPEAPPVLPKVRVGFDLTIELSEAVRDCVVFLQGPPLHLNMSKFAEEACRREIERLQHEANEGEPFPKRQQAPRTGRPVG